MDLELISFLTLLSLNLICLAVAVIAYYTCYRKSSDPDYKGNLDAIDLVLNSGRSDDKSEFLLERQIDEEKFMNFE